MTRVMFPFLALLLLASQGIAVAPADAADTCRVIAHGETLAELADNAVAKGGGIILIRHDDKVSDTGKNVDLSSDGRKHAEKQMRKALASVLLDKVAFYAEDVSEPRVENTARAVFEDDVRAEKLGANHGEILDWLYAKRTGLPDTALLVVFVNSVIIDRFDAGTGRNFACSEGLIGVVEMQESETRFDCLARFFPEETQGSGKAKPDWFKSTKAPSCRPLLDERESREK